MTSQTKKVFFFSDQHFGVPSSNYSSKEREMMLVTLLDKIKDDASEIIFMGDLFDFWFEYKTVIQKGYVRLLGKIAELCDAGIAISYYRGNHDVWAFDYLEKEVGVTLHRKPAIRTINGKRFYLAHGDGLGKGDNGYKFLKRVFENRINQWLFRWVHPDFSTGIALWWSRKSRYANIAKAKKQHLESSYKACEATAKKRLTPYCQSILDSGEEIDFFVFGHYHAVLTFNTESGVPIYTIGDWIDSFSYAEFDGTEFKQIFYKQ